MALAYVETMPNVFVAWRGQPIGEDAVKYPPNIADLWSAEDLAALALFTPAPAEPVPDGKRIISTAVKRVDGVVRFVHELADEPPPALEDYSAAVQALLDHAARSRDYADIVSAVSYAGSSVPAWAAEGAAFAAWRDAVWIYAYNELAKVQAGERAQPSIIDFLAELPTLGLVD
jgi:hypothetical protein